MPAQTIFPGSVSCTSCRLSHWPKAGGHARYRLVARLHNEVCPMLIRTPEHSGKAAGRLWRALRNIERAC